MLLMETIMQDDDMLPSPQRSHLKKPQYYAYLSENSPIVDIRSPTDRPAMVGGF